MPLHFGKIFGAIALLTVAAFVLWLLFTTFFATEEADQKIERTGAVELGGGSLSLGRRAPGRADPADEEEGVGP